MPNWNKLSACVSLAACLAALPAAVQGQERSESPLAGLWRLTGTDRVNGDYSDLIEFVPSAGGGFTYARTPIAGDNGISQGELEHGDVVVTRRFAYSKQTLSTPGFGMLREGFGVESETLLDLPQRHARYAFDARTPDRIRGLSIIPTRLSVAREELIRVRDDEDNNHVELLIDGEQFFGEMRRDLESAERSICLQTFIYTEDSTGRWVARILMERAREGVEVRLLVDGLNSKISRQLKGELRAAGVELIVQHGWGQSIVGAFNNLGASIWGSIKSLFGKPRKPREKRGLFNHDHRKITLVDGRVGFVGGMNVAREYEREWHDIQARVQGDAVGELEDLFYERWAAAGGEVDRRPEPAAETQSVGYFPGDMPVDVVTTLPGLSSDIKARYLAEIDGARDRIYIENAYFLDESIIGALKRKAQQGLDTVVIIPNDEKHDVKIVRDAFQWVQNDVVNSGIRLYKYREAMVHSKVAAFDGRVSTVGSANLDNLALEELAEANLFVLDAGFTREMERRVFDRDIPRSDRVRAQKFSWWQRVKSGVLHFFRTML